MMHRLRMHWRKHKRKHTCLHNDFDVRSLDQRQCLMKVGDLRGLHTTQTLRGQSCDLHPVPLFIAAVIPAEPASALDMDTPPPSQTKPVFIQTSFF